MRKTDQTQADLNQLLGWHQSPSKIWPVLTSQKRAIPPLLKLSIPDLISAAK
ncbi:MAG TPA: hypothetical protein VK203_11745 [Nostocaceae cyanobacterium]|nr:hypothetical protein [Nostocaceae cyanobacterium]